jgi:hypothetical protein
MATDIRSQVDGAIHAHTQWLVRLQLAIKNATSEFKPEIVKTDNNCAFGKWLYSEIPDEIKKTPLYEEIKQLHASFHQRAGEILDLALQKKQAEALRLMDEGGLRKTSYALVGKLSTLKNQGA